ncbi:MFS transporter [Sporolactobacillus shoreicorticis]|uniref:MFS transporter n=1 Tax=Sporolactobacillus shoreicorticis TaxID=1923877 RepID=A0ABW5SAK9_9BACL|nr:MFS transporter [Sporolactobacillus shoreicorticis]MCO7127412.1 MFS transporter [Sporolactobacillus shoreicorticis]
MNRIRDSWANWKSTLKNKNMRAFTLSRSMSRLVTNIIPIVIPWQILKIEHSSSSLLAYYLTIYTLFLAIGSILSGFFIDRYGPKLSLLFCEVFRSLIAVMTPLGLLTSYGGSFLLGAILGFFGGAASIATNVIPKRILTNSEIPHGVATLQSSGQFIFLIIPFISGAVLSNINSYSLWYLIGLFYLFASFPLLLIKEKNVKDDRVIINKKSRGSIEEVKESMQLLFHNSYIHVFIIASIVIGITMTGIQDVIVPHELINSMHVNSYVYGMVTPIWQYGLLAGSLLLGIFPPKKLRVFIYSSIMFSFTIIFFIFPSEILFIIGLIFLGILMSYQRSTSIVFLNQTVPGNVLGKISGILDFIDFVFQPLSLWLANLAIVYNLINTYEMACIAIIIVPLIFLLGRVNTLKFTNEEKNNFPK